MDESKEDSKYAETNVSERARASQRKAMQLFRSTLRLTVPVI
jgi:hypothetical protein